MIAIGGLESIFKLSVIMNMVDNLTSPLVRVTSAVDDSANKIQSMGIKFGDLAKGGAAVAGIGGQITDAVLKPVEATFDSQKALGELSSLGIKDLGALDEAAENFSNTWAGTSKADFISAAYDIKSGINSLSDTGVAQYTTLAGQTAEATKSTIGEMTSLFATGYGIYKDYYSKMSDADFGKMFSAGISTAVQKFKTTGSGMSDAIKMLGASATTAKVPLEEQLSVLGMLQATMSGSEAGTKYKAFLREAAKGGKELGLSFTDANNQLLSLPEILGKLKGKFGDTLDAAEKMKIQQAFGDEEAVSLIDLMYSKTGSLQNNIVGMYGALGQGTKVTTDMANAINNTDPNKFEVLKQKAENIKDSIGTTLLPTINSLMSKGNDMLTKVGAWAKANPQLVSGIMKASLALGGFLSVGGTAVAVFGGAGLILTKTANLGKNAIGVLEKIPGAITDIRIVSMYAGDSLKAFGGHLATGAGFAKDFAGKIGGSTLSGLKTFGGLLKTGAVAVKDFGAGLVKMAAQGIASAVRALPGLISSVWSFTAALFANPVTWIVIGIVALTAAIILLGTHWSQVTAWLQGTWNGFIGGVISGFNKVKSWFSGLPGWAQIAVTALLPFIGIPLQIITHWSQIKSFFGNLWNSITNGAKGMINGVIGVLNGFHVTIPSWVPGMGGKTFGFQIPKLAEGGVVDSATTFIAGESGREAVMPLENNTGWISSLAENLFSRISGIATGNAPEKANIQPQPVKRVSLRESTSERTDTERTTTAKEKGVVIQKLYLSVDFNKISNLPKLMKLFKELEDYIHENGGETDDLTPEPA